MIKSGSKYGSGLFAQIRSLNTKFWYLNILQMLEKLAYWSVLLQMPVFTAQKGIEGGLNWEQWVKGLVFFIWAMVQNLTPFFFGFLPDKAGRKKITVISIILLISGYSILGTQRDFYIFIAGIMLVGVGSGLFKPSIQGAISLTLDKGNSSTGWGVYFMLLNLAVIAAPPLSKYLKEISWEWVFIGSSAISILNLFAASFWKDVKSSRMLINLSASIKESMKEFITPKYLYLIICMSGFAIIYMQFYETLPNFIYDWSDTSGIAISLNLPKFMMMSTPLGQMISYEWLYNINSIIVTLFVVVMSWLTGFTSKIKAIMLGIGLAAGGLLLAGMSMSGTWLVAGFVLYSIGELITNPKFAEQLSTGGDEKRKSMHLGFLNLSLAAGLGLGALIGGTLYGAWAEKSSLALRYIDELGIKINDVNLTNSVQALQNKLGMNAAELSRLLWDSYNPWIIWIPFCIIAIASIAGLLLYERKNISSD